MPRRLYTWRSGRVEGLPRRSARERHNDRLGLLASATWRAADVISARPRRDVDGGRGHERAVVDLVCAPLGTEERGVLLT